MCVHSDRFSFSLGDIDSPYKFRVISGVNIILNISPSIWETEYESNVLFLFLDKEVAFTHNAIVKDANCGKGLFSTMAYLSGMS